MDLHNETVVNVAALLKEHVGSTRTYRLSIDQLTLDQNLEAKDVTGSVRLTRLTGEIIAGVRVSGSVDLECQRCLGIYPQPFTARFEEEFRETVDVRTGAGVSTFLDGEDEHFDISENHELDFGEPLRQEIIVALPMRPACGDQCPGPDLLEVGNDDVIDNRFAELAKLLDDDSAT